MEHRLLGRSGLKVSALGFGAATFGGNNAFFQAWGTTDAVEARRLVDICLEGGVNLFDTANSYSNGLSESILGAALKGRRDKVLISTKATTPLGSGPNEGGSSRRHVLQACEDSLRRLGTDYIDLYHMHEYDATTPIEETLSTLDDLVRSGKVRYVACSNFSGWHLMKSLALADKHGRPQYVAHQVYYSLAAREFEWELMPLGLDQGVGTLVYGALASGALSGKVRRGRPAPEDSRLHKLRGPGMIRSEEMIYKIVGVLDEVAEETGKTVSQIAINWLLQRPTVSSVVVGARTEEQLKDNLGAAGGRLDDSQMARLEAASEMEPVYPYSHQRGYPQFHPVLEGNRR